MCMCKSSSTGLVGLVFSAICNSALGLSCFKQNIEPFRPNFKCLLQSVDKETRHSIFTSCTFKTKKERRATHWPHWKKSCYFFIRRMRISRWRQWEKAPNSKYKGVKLKMKWHMLSRWERNWTKLLRKRCRDSEVYNVQRNFPVTESVCNANVNV